MKPNSEGLMSKGATRDKLYGEYVSTQVVRDATNFPKAWRQDQAGLSAQILRLLPKDRTVRIIDLGCGHGSFVDLLRKVGYINVEGVDGSSSQLELARLAGVEGLIEGDAIEFIASRKESVDVVTAIDLVEHLTKDELVQFVHSVYAALKKGGVFIVRTPNAAGPFGAKRRYDDLTHELSLTQNSVTQLLLSCGFQEIDVRSVPPHVTGVKSAIRRLLWALIELGGRGYLAVETGSASGYVLTQNLISVARKND